MTLTIKKSIFVAAIIFALQSAAGTVQAALFECTGRNNECTICDFFAMVAATIGFTLKVVVPLLLVLILAFGGLMMIYKKDDPEILERVKNIFKGLVIGALVAYGGWVLVTASLAGSGSFNKDSWWKFTLNCTVQEPEPVVAQPVNRLAPVGSQVSCGGALAEKIGMGCIVSGDLNDLAYCRQGRYECDPANNQLVCREIVPQIYDECCKDGGKSLDSMPLEIVRAQRFLEMYNISDSGFSFDCNQICKIKNKTCVGVGLSNVGINKCVSVRHHENGLCDMTSNLQKEDCRSNFRLGSGGCIELNSRCGPGLEPCTTINKLLNDDTSKEEALGLSKDINYVQFNVEETACYCM
jgi:hypothetical protein